MDISDDLVTSWPDPEKVLKLAPPLIKCEYCPQIRSTPNPADFRCLSCQILVCTKCKTAHKVIAMDNADHEVVTFKNPRKSNANKL